MANAPSTSKGSPTKTKGRSRFVQDTPAGLIVLERGAGKPFDLVAKPKPK